MTLTSISKPLLRRASKKLSSSTYTLATKTHFASFSTSSREISLSYRDTPKLTTSHDLHPKLNHNHNININSTAHKHHFTTTTATMTASSSTKNLSAATLQVHLDNRRSYYVLSKNSVPLPPSEIDAIVTRALQTVPSSFNSQSNRAVSLHGPEHDKFWDIVSEVLKPAVPAAQWESVTGPKLAGFRAAAGTILFFEDQDVVNAMQEKFATYADKFPLWASQSDAMLQYAVWTALEAEGLGANLQHYNPLVDERVAAEWGIPTSWKLNAQMVFGAIAAEAYPKETKPVDEKFKSFGA